MRNHMRNENGCATLTKIEQASGNLMRHCLFCDQRLSNKNKAKEHVYKKSWLEKLELSRVEIITEAAHQDEVLSTNFIPTNQVLTGEVCANCNNGWMNKLDLQIEDVVLHLARNPGQVSYIASLSNEKRQLIGRWLLKVACVLEYSDTRNRRHIPQQVRSNVRNPGYLPPGFFAFAVSASSRQQGVGICILDAWTTGANSPSNLPQSKRLKFAIRYHNIVLCCSYILTYNPTYKPITGFHLPIIHSQTNIEYQPITELFQYQSAMVFGRPASITEFALIAMGATSAPL